LAIEKVTGLFITLEGPEGCGKTTQAPRLAALLRENGWDVLLTREPGGTPISEAIRQLLHDPANSDMRSSTEILMYCAARAQLVGQQLIPHLQKGGAVICDRFADSTVAYQGYGRGIDIHTLGFISDFAAEGLHPNITFLLDVPVEIGLGRRKQSGGEWNRMDALAVEFHQRVRQGYLELAHQDPTRWSIINASVGVDQVWEQIKRVIEPFLPIP
jgi:dTMP kinase